MTYTVALYREADGRYSVSVPALKGCHTWGYNIAHALEMVHEAASGYLDVLVEEGDPIPEDTPDIALDMAETDEAFVCKISVSEVAAVA